MQSLSTRRGRRVLSRIVSGSALLLAIAPGSWAAVTFEPVRPPLQGFADIHNHQFANLGFGGRFLWGKPFDPGGIDAALPWCDYLPGKGPAPFQPALWVHGPGGIGDLVGNFLGGRLGHKVGGFPEFDGWPNFDSYSHQQVYVDWLHRAYVGGLRLMVMHAVNNKVLCQAIRGGLSCDDLDAVDRQIAAAKQLEQFIDQHINTDGVAEVGLLPDFIEDLRQQNVNVNPLFRSAEAYVHMWERADQHRDFSPVTTATASPAARSTAITLTANQPAGWPVQSIT